MKKYDVVVIGSGPGGYVAAIRCAQLGKKTAVVERYETLGGTCLNVGCIPSKTLLESASNYYEARKNFAKHGISFQDLQFDFSKTIERKNKVISQNSKGVQALFKNNGIDRLSGHASFVDEQHIQVTKSDGSMEQVSADRFIIATGSKPYSLPGIDIDKDRIITSTEALSLTSVPDSMVIIGAGVIGLELGSVYAKLGTKVQILEIVDTILPSMDRQLCKELMRSLKKTGIKFNLECKVEKAVKNNGKALVTAIDKQGKELRLEADYCLTAIGRKPYTENLGLEEIGIKTDKKGAIQVDQNLQTSISHIFAIGDVICGPMLAHKASEEGIFAAEIIAGKQPKLNYAAIPSVVYTSPEAASVGYTEEDLMAENRRYTSGICPIRVLGRAHAADKLDGMVKVLADPDSSKLLGIHMVAPYASEMIAEAVVALGLDATAKETGHICHAHPTFSEALKEACHMAVENRAIHVMAAKKPLA